ncbi:hypothetical protein TSUD_260920 [Trifolium subterraneum]|uniref:Uncharacterized protein n=1 Tax=Trifolium subterraneum TaxID=3900 RepID=A0A2Z6M9Y1_TRISU|nr:hypothetical protein TSUD_260920 [Trifolium subterraneum]
MVAYSQCQYPGLAPASIKAVEAAISLVERKPWNGEGINVEFGIQYDPALKLISGIVMQLEKLGAL